MSQNSVSKYSVPEYAARLNDFASWCLQDEEKLGTKTFNFSNFTEVAKELPKQIIVLGDSQEAPFMFYQDMEIVFEYFLKSTENNLDKGNLDTELLKSCIQILEILFVFLKTMVGTMEQSARGIPQYKCIPFSTLNVIQASYLHCKTSESAYGEYFTMATELLQSLYQKTFLIQKCFAVFLSKLMFDSNNPASMDEMDLYQNVCNKLMEMTSIVEGMDNNLVAVTWKLLISFAIKFEPVLKTQLDIDGIVDQLTSLLQTNLKGAVDILQQYIDETSSKAYTMHCRMACFFMEGLTTIIQHYNTDVVEGKLANLVGTIFQLLLPVIKTDETSTKLNPKLRNLIVQHFMAELNKYLNIVVNHDTLREHVLNPESQQQPITRLVILLHLIQPISCCRDPPVWFKPTNQRRSIIEIFFDLTASVYTELSTTTCIQIDGVTIPLYDCIVSHISGVVSAFDTLQPIEAVLLENLLSPHPYRSVLAADVWCFMARLYPSEVCMQQINSLSMLSKKLPIPMLTSLVARLYQFLLPQHQSAVLGQLESNLGLWEILSSSGHQFPLPNLIDSCQSFVNMIDRWVGDGGSIMDMGEVMSTISIVGNLLRGHDVVGEIAKNPVFKQHLNSVNESLQSLWTILPTSLAGGFVQFASEIMWLTTVFVKLQFDLDISIILNKVLSWLQMHQNNTMVLHVAKFMVYLEGLGHKMVDQDLKIQVWQQVFSNSKKSWLLHHNVLDEVESFSRVTKNPAQIGRICGDDGIEVLKSHLQRVPTACKVPTTEIHIKHAAMLANSTIPPIKMSASPNAGSALVNKVTTSVKNLNNSKHNLTMGHKKILQESINILTSLIDRPT